MRLRVGFVPLTDAAPLIVAEAQGFFADEGLEVELVREVSWATVRDKLAAGVFDAAHMLAPMALAAAMGVGSPAASFIAPLTLARGGAAIVLSSRLGSRAAQLAGLAALIARRRDEAFAVVHAFSIHNYLLRRWLASAGLDPEHDVRLIVAAPSRLVELLEEGVIEGFCAGEPWGTCAQSARVGNVALRAGELWPDAPDKLLAVRAEWASSQPETLQRLIRALARAQQVVDGPGNRAAVARLLSHPGRLALAADQIAPGLSHIVFAREDGGRPVEAAAAWLVDEMRRWGQIDSAADLGAARGVFRADLFDAAIDS